MNYNFSFFFFSYSDGIPLILTVWELSILDSISCTLDWLVGWLGFMTYQPLSVI